MSAVMVKVDRCFLVDDYVQLFIGSFCIWDAVDYIVGFQIPSWSIMNFSDVYGND